MMYLTDMKQPTVINVLDDMLNPIGILEQYSSLTLSPSFFDVGSFEITLPMSDEALSLVQEDRIVEFGTGGQLAGIIVGIGKALNSPGRQMRVFGPLLNGLMKRRVVVPSDDPELLGWDVASGTVGSIMAHYVNDHAIAPIIPARKIPLLRLAQGIERVGMVTVAKARFDDLNDVLTSVAQYASVGWRIVITDGALEFQALNSVDRTQDSDAPLIISTAFKNIATADSTIDKTDYANTVYALGEGQYENRLYQVYYSDDQSVSGWARCETVADCGNEPSVTRLRELAMQKIEELEKYNSLTLQLIPGQVGANLGDMPTLYIPEIDIRYDLLITALKLTWSGMQKRIEVTLGKPPRTLTGQLQRTRRLQNIT